MSWSELIQALNGRLHDKAVHDPLSGPSKRGRVPASAVSWSFDSPTLKKDLQGGAGGGHHRSSRYVASLSPVTLHCLPARERENFQIATGGKPS